MSEIIKYIHHGVEVAVEKDSKGKHRKYCLCWKCAFFNPENREVNCPIANTLFGINVKYHITTPVWECGKFVEV